MDADRSHVARHDLEFPSPERHRFRVRFWQRFRVGLPESDGERRYLSSSRTASALGEAAVNRNAVFGGTNWNSCAFSSRGGPFSESALTCIAPSVITRRWAQALAPTPSRLPAASFTVEERTRFSCHVV